jgi:hypothetical protein
MALIPITTFVIEFIRGLNENIQRMNVFYQLFGRLSIIRSLFGRKEAWHLLTCPLVIPGEGRVAAGRSPAGCGLGPERWP